MHLDGEGSLGGVRLQVDLHGSCFTAGCNQFVPQFLQSVAAVGDQLPDEHLVGGRGWSPQVVQLTGNRSDGRQSSYLFLRVQGPGNDVQQLFRLGLKFMFGEAAWIDDRNDTRKTSAWSHATLIDVRKCSSTFHRLCVFDDGMQRLLLRLLLCLLGAVGHLLADGGAGLLRAPRSEPAAPPLLLTHLQA